MTYKLVGQEPYQVPTNADLGSLAYQNSDGVQLGQLSIANTASITGLVTALTVAQSQAAAGTLLLLTQIPTNIVAGQAIVGTGIAANTTITSVVSGFSVPQLTYTGTTATTIVAMTATYGISAGMAVYGTGITYGTTVSSLVANAIVGNYTVTTSTSTGNVLYIGSTAGLVAGDMVIGNANITTGTLVTGVVTNYSVTLNSSILGTINTGTVIVFAPTITLSQSIVANPLTQYIFVYPSITLSQASSSAVAQNAVTSVYVNPTSSGNAALVIQNGGLGVAGNSYFANNITVAGTIYSALTGISTTATNIAGAVPGAIPIQVANGVTAFISTGTSGQLLQMQTGNTATWVSLGSLVAGTASTSTQVYTAAQTSSASYYPTFVNANNASATGMSVYTTSSFVINPATGAVTHLAATSATSTVTGAVQVVGGIGVGGNSWFGGNLVVSAPGSQPTSSNARVSISNNAIYSQMPVTTGTDVVIFGGSNQNGVNGPNLLIQSTANGSPQNPQIQLSSQQNGGAFGPLGVLNFTGYANNIVQSGAAIVGYSPLSGQTTVSGGIQIYTANGVTTGTTAIPTSLRLQVDPNGITTVYSSTASVSTTTGALQVIGGVGIGGGLVVGGTVTSTNIVVSSNIAVSGTVTATNIAFTGSLIGVSNRPSVRPSLLLDFANTKQLDPRITFTRASTGAYYDGKTTALAEQNLLLQSQVIGASPWGTPTATAATNSVAAPDGTTTASLITVSAQFGGVLQVVVLLASTVYTVSAWVLASSGTNQYNLQVGGNVGPAFTPTGTWTRQSYTFTNTSAGAFNMYAVIDRNASGFGSVYVWGAQLEQRASATAYNVTTTAAITNYIPVLQTVASGVARFDSNPTTGESLGLLIEEQRTNLSVPSVLTGVGGNGWTSVTPNSNIAPDGSLSATRYTWTAFNNCYISSLLVTNTAATAYTGSIYVKANILSTNAYSLQIGRGDSGQFARAIFNASTNTVSTSTGGADVSNASATVTAAGNSWYRITITATFANSYISAFGLSVVALATNGDAFIWGAQLEAGAFATSYIPTVASQVTRAADAASMTGVNFSSWYNVGQGTLYAEAAISNTGTFSGSDLVGITNASGTGMELYKASNNAGMTIYAGTNSAVLTTSVPVGAFNKFAFTQTGVISASGVYNGATPVSVTPTLYTPTLLGIGKNVANPLCCWIKRIAYYPVVLASTELQALTT